MFEDMFDDEFDGDDDFVAPIESQGLKSPRENPDVLGNQATEDLLLSLYNQGKLPHALIFAGPMGVGKCTMAFRLARFLLKHGAGKNDNQGGLFGDAPPPLPASFHVAKDDPVFYHVASGGHPDLRYFDIPTDDRTGKLKTGVDVESVRKIPTFLKTTTAEGGWKIVIVDFAETMTWQAQNAILKILEEPPSKSLLILICSRLGSMLPTIRSRCRVFNFAPLNPENLAVLLKQAAPSATNLDIKILTQLADGSMGKAQSIIDENGINMFRIIVALMDEWPHWDWTKIHPMADDLARAENLKSYRGFAQIFEWICQSLLRAKAMQNPALPEILQIDALDRLLKHYSLEQWIEICEKLNEHFIAIEKSSLDKHHGVIGAFSQLG